MRVGLGYDIHRLIPTEDGGSIRIGGVNIPCHFRVEAHSDGDVLCHALVDAMLGALALGDMGQWFSDEDEKNRDRNSKDFVSEIFSEIRLRGWEVNQMDSIISLEKPKLMEHVDSIRRNLAGILGVELSQISVKAKRGEGLGPVGRREAIVAQVVITLKETAKIPQT